MNTKTWTTRPSSQTLGNLPWWKKQFGEVCPHGLEIYLVDGTHIRNVHDSDFCQGGHEFAYEFIPAGEIWVDNITPPAELPFVVFHECYEREKMKKGMSYDKAHDMAKSIEDRERARVRPGEP